MPGIETANRVSRKKKIHNACDFIYNDPRGSEGLILKARLLGKRMKNMPIADVEDYLLKVAEKDPDKIIDLYTGHPLSIRLENGGELTKLFTSTVQDVIERNIV